MSKCAVKRGIVTLRDCGNEAGDACAECSRPMCQEHSRISGAELLCVECFARRQQGVTPGAAGAAAGAKQGPGKAPGKAPGKTAASATAQDDSWQDSSWPYYYRHHYYTTSYYSPFYTGSYYDSYYDNYDVRSFSTPQTDDFADESTAGGFYDS